MANWHGYVLLKKPAALSADEWLKVLLALKKRLGKADDDPQPARRLHWRLSADNSVVLIEAVFDTADLDATDTKRLCKYISEALDGKYTPLQVRTALQNNVTVFGKDRPWLESRATAVAAISAEKATWESDEATAVTKDAEATK